ncbi:hypothetical protein [Streptomyces sp. NPDC048309]|uniref:hypothetical protein n=1 Tax=unclassified Streptomyces TaxID=2593676 RepID=UPI0033F4D556
MISTRRMVAAVGLAIGVTGLAAPMASAAASGPQDAGKLNPMTQLDSLALSGIPAERQGEFPLPSRQLAGLTRLTELDELRPVTDLAAPVTGLLSGTE